MLPNCSGWPARSNMCTAVDAVTRMMMKMIRTDDSVARSLAMTRPRVAMAGAWTPSFRIQRMQKTTDALLLAFSEPVVIAKAGTTASRPINPLIEQAQRRRAAVSVMPAWRADSGAAHIRATYSARNMPATVTIVAVKASSREPGSLSTDERVTAN